MSIFYLLTKRIVKYIWHLNVEQINMKFNLKLSQKNNKYVESLTMK
mgnify:CR=1 FL=1